MPTTYMKQVQAYPNLSKLEESIKLEKTISFDTANKERDALIDVVSKSATKPTWETGPKELIV